jgi:adsorption protein B
VEKGLISEEQLEQAITSPVRRRLGRELLRGWLTSEQLVQTLAEQLDLPWAPLNPFKLDRS